MTHSAKMHIAPNSTQTSNVQIFLIFLKLGCLSFGGPAAHLVFFHRKFVHQLKWLSDSQYGQLVALSQIIPGPSSSQVGIAIGYLCKGYLGSISAWLGFTLPSFILMTSLAFFGQYFFNNLSPEVFHVVKLIVLAVVAFAFWQMLQSFCKAIWQYLLMLASALFIYVSDWTLSQVILIFIAAICGLIFSEVSVKKKKKGATPSTTSFKNVSSNHKSFPAYVWLLIFILPFIVFPILKAYFASPALQSLESFYQTAALVFGGGHVVLPLLHHEFIESGLISGQKFDLGYAFVQLMPGPLFSFASYLGALLPFSDSILLNAVIATCAIFLPSFFLIYGTLPYWSWLMNQPKIYQAVAGINAAVVGLLFCLIIEMTESNIRHWRDIVFVTCVVVLLRTRLPVAITIILSFSAYYAFLTQFNL